MRDSIQSGIDVCRLIELVPEIERRMSRLLTVLEEVRGVQHEIQTDLDRLAAGTGAPQPLDELFLLQ